MNPRSNRGSARPATVFRDRRRPPSAAWPVVDVGNVGEHVARVDRRPTSRRPVSRAAELALKMAPRCRRSGSRPAERVGGRPSVSSAAAHRRVASGEESFGLRQVLVGQSGNGLTVDRPRRRRAGKPAAAMPTRACAAKTARWRRAVCRNACAVRERLGKSGGRSDPLAASCVFARSTLPRVAPTGSSRVVDPPHRKRRQSVPPRRRGRSAADRPKS